MTTKTNLKALYSSLFVHNLTSKAICSECEDFCLQFSKKNHILEMKAHSETNFENENMFLEVKWKVINPFFKKQNKNLDTTS